MDIGHSLINDYNKRTTERNTKQLADLKMQIMNDIENQSRNNMNKLQADINKQTSERVKAS
jgi:hypothetical protein